MNHTYTYLFVSLLGCAASIFSAFANLNIDYMYIHFGYGALFLVIVGLSLWDNWKIRRKLAESEQIIKNYEDPIEQKKKKLEAISEEAKSILKKYPESSLGSTPAYKTFLNVSSTFFEMHKNELKEHYSTAKKIFDELDIIESDLMLHKLIIDYQSKLYSLTCQIRGLLEII